MSWRKMSRMIWVGTVVNQVPCPVALPISDEPLSAFGGGPERSGAREDKSRVIITQKG